MESTATQSVSQNPDLPGEPLPFFRKNCYESAENKAFP
jgi:hypothetical protein